MSGVFPDGPKFGVTRYPLTLVEYTDCTLLQLAVSCPLGEMYAQGYGHYLADFLTDK